MTDERHTETAPDFRIEQSELRVDDEMAEWSTQDLPYYIESRGSFEKLPWATDPEAIAAVNADAAIVGVPLDDGTSGRPGARFGPRAIRNAPTAWSSTAMWSIQLDVDPFAHLVVVDAGDAPVVPSRLARGLRVTHEKVFGVAGTGAIPLVLGGDHSITYPSAAAVARHRWPSKVGIVHFDAHADTGDEVCGSLVVPRHPDASPDRRGLGGRTELHPGGLRGYWPEKETWDWMREHELRWHTMVEIEERGSEAVIADAIARSARRSGLHLPVASTSMWPTRAAPGTGTPEPGGMSARELLRAVRQIVGAVDLAGMDVVEVSPPYDAAELTAMLAHRCVMETISALARRRAEASASRTAQ